MKSSGAIKERPRFFVIVVLLLGVLVVNELLVRAGTVQGVAFMLLPVFALLGFAFALRPHATLWLYIAVNYYILGLTRYVDLKGGMLMMGFSVLLLVVLFVSQWLGKVEWRRGFNQLTPLLDDLVRVLYGARFPAERSFRRLDDCDQPVRFYPFAAGIRGADYFPQVPRPEDFPVRLFVAYSDRRMQGAVAENGRIRYRREDFLYQEGGASTHIIWSGNPLFFLFHRCGEFRFGNGVFDGRIFDRLGLRPGVAAVLLSGCRCRRRLRFRTVGYPQRGDRAVRRLRAVYSDHEEQTDLVGRCRDVGHPVRLL